MAVQALSSTAELIAALPLAQLSVVLFTAAWSRDSIPARAALDRVAIGFPPPAEPPHVAFYSVPLPITEVHASPPRRARGFWRPGAAAVYTADRAAYNATRQLPWFPALRVFAGENTGGVGPGLSPFTYGDSYTAPAMRRFVLDVAHRVVEDLERHEEVLPLDSGNARILAAPACPSSFGVGLQRGHSGTGECRSLSAAAAGGLLSVAGSAGRSRTALTTLLPRVGDPVEMSPDGLTNVLLRKEGSPVHDVPCGALLFVPGGVETVTVHHRGLWRVLSSAVDSENAHDQRTWVASVINSFEFGEFSDRFGVAPTLADPKLVLLDCARDVVLHASALPNTTASAVTLLQSLAASDPYMFSLLKPLSIVDPAAAIAARMPLLARSERVQHVRPPDLDEVSSSCATRGHGVWVVVHQRWCGFSQRAMAVFREFADIAPGNVCIFEVSDLDGLPDAANKFVDGFPTVLRVVNSGGSGVACKDRICEYTEHVGELSVATLLEDAVQG